MIEWHEGDTVVDMVAAARGPLGARAEGSFRNVRGEYYRVFLYRKEDGEDKVYDLDLEAFYERGDTTANPTVQPDDIIMVPANRDVNIQTIIQDLPLIPQLMSLFN